MPAARTSMLRRAACVVLGCRLSPNADHLTPCYRRPGTARIVCPRRCRRCGSTAWSEVR